MRSIQPGWSYCNFTDLEANVWVWSLLITDIINKNSSIFQSYLSISVVRQKTRFAMRFIFSIILREYHHKLSIHIQSCLGVNHSRYTTTSRGINHCVNVLVNVKYLWGLIIMIVEGHGCKGPFWEVIKTWWIYGQTYK